MRVHLSPCLVPSRAVSRLHTALQVYAPKDLAFVEDERDAELVVLTVVGRFDRITAQAKQIRQRGQRYAVIQLCLKSTQQPNPMAWCLLWTHASAVWSYYNLPHLLRVADKLQWMKPPFQQANFYFAPLGVDPNLFTYATGARPYTVTAMSRHWLTESLRECALAAEAVGGQAVHIGPPQIGRPVLGINDPYDSVVVTTFQHSQFVSGLRRIEGFELPAAEGLLCGARPILFDQSHYRDWYGPWGVFIPEGPREDVLDRLIQIFTEGAEPVTPEEREQAAERFSWPTIIGGFWERV